MNSQSRLARLSLLAIGSLALLIPLLILSAPASAGKGRATATPSPTRLPGDSPLPTPETPLTPTLPEGAAAGGESLDGGWKLLYNPPVVAPFSGAVSYDVAVELPPGRGGLLLPVNLSYNSRRVDGILAWVQDWAGVGWSVDLVDVAREGETR